MRYLRVRLGVISALSPFSVNTFTFFIFDCAPMLGKEGGICAPPKSSG